MELVAKSVLDECYARSRQDAHLLLTRQIKQLGNMTCLLHVDRQHLMEFAEHSACQTKLSTIWKGSLSLHTSEFKVRSNSGIQCGSNLSDVRVEEVRGLKRTLI